MLQEPAPIRIIVGLDSVSWENAYGVPDVLLGLLERLDTSYEVVLFGSKTSVAAFEKRILSNDTLQGKAKVVDSEELRAEFRVDTPTLEIVPHQFATPQTPFPKILVFFDDHLVKVASKYSNSSLYGKSRRNLALSDLVVFPFPGVFEDLPGTLGFERERFVFCPDVLDNPGAPSGTFVAQPNSDIEFFFPSKLDVHKAHFFLIETAKVFGRLGLRWKIVCSGDGNTAGHRKKLIGLANSLGASDGIEFVGRLSQDEFLVRASRASAFVSPSLAEGGIYSLMKLHRQFQKPLVSNWSHNAEADAMHHGVQVHWFDTGNVMSLIQALQASLDQNLGVEGKRLLPKRPEGIRFDQAIHRALRLGPSNSNLEDQL